MDEIVRRHEVLRTTFQSTEGTPVQVIAAGLQGFVEEVNLKGKNPEMREEKAQKDARTEAGRPFDLQQGPLVRVKLLRLEEDDHVMLATMHHIVSDGWSMGVMVREFMQLYAAYVKGEGSPLEELKIQYADFAVWQRQWLQGSFLEEQLQYWEQELEGATALELPADRPRPPVASHRGGTVEFDLGAELSDKIRRFSREHEATVFMSLLAAFQALLSRYSGQKDIVVGTDVANRNRLEIEPLIGFFVNQLVLRTKLEEGVTVGELLKQVRKVTLASYVHQDVPFENLVERVAPQRDMSRSPLFQVKLVLQNAERNDPSEMRRTRVGDLEVAPFGGKAVGVKLDLEVLLVETEKGIRGELRYARDLFDAARIERMAAHWRRLLEGWVVSADQPVFQLQMLSEAERKQIVEEWNRTQVDYPPEKFVLQMFEEQVERTPAANAVESEGQKLTYRELNCKANQLAHYLKQMGIGPEALVGICVERSLEMVVGLLGILKAGAAYVPLDPDHPTERLAFMLEDAQIPVLLTQERLRDRLPGGLVQVVCIDQEWSQIEQQSGENPVAAVSGANLAYVIYTSGSTGKPKGVGVTHGGLANYLNWARVAYKVEQGRGSVVHSSLGFDLTVTSLYPALLSGGCVTVLRQDARAEELARNLEWSDYSLLKLTPSHLQMLSSLLEKSGMGTQGARALVIGGEALKYADLDLWRKKEASVRLINEYGPTETVVGCVVHEVGKERGTAEVPIGSPISNTRIYVLDENLEPSPVGVGGELYIAGAGLARGYLNRPELTAEKFVPDPFSQAAGERLYRTGDRARWQAKEQLEFLGRLDQQVKVRGYRIELGEIEAALLAHGGVEQAVVVVRGTGAEQQLVGYVVGKAGTEELKPGQLRSYLKEHLPEYMVPGVMMPLAELPLTANGKVDRKALPNPEVRMELDKYIAPRNEVEETLCGIFAEVLKLERVGVEQNFFEAGGHSLLAMQVLARVRSVLAIDLPVRALFEAPTVAGLAQWVVRMREEGHVAAPPLVRIGREGDLQLSFAQQRLWVLDQVMPGSTSYNIPLALVLRGDLDVEALKKGIREIVRRHEVLRTRFEASDGGPRQIIEAEAPLDMDVVEMSGGTEEDRVERLRRLAQEETQKPFDLKTGPLIRVKLLRVQEQMYALFLTMHHIVSDAVSMGVAVREMTALYAAYSAGKESPLPELPIQYADYAAWQRGWLQGEVLEQQIAYWKRELESVKPLEMPVDRPREWQTSQSGAVAPFILSEELSSRLRELSLQEDVTIFMVLMAAFQTLLYRYSGQQDFAVGTPIAGRTEVETEGMIGFFVNTLVLPAQVGGNPAFREVLKRMKEKTLSAYGRQDVPFERLVDSLQIERNVNRTPLFQAMLSYQNTGVETDLELGGVKLWSLHVQNPTAKFELLLTVMDAETMLVGGLEYFADLFDEATISTMVRRLQHLLLAVVENPEQCIDGIALLSADEQQELERGWSSQATGERRAVSLVARVREHARRRPEAWVVVREDGEELSYGELERQSNRLGRRLQEAGVKPGAVVGISMAGMGDWLTAAMGVMKAGAAFVPLESDEAEARRRRVMEEAGVEWVVTENRRKQPFEAMSVQVMNLDGEGEDEGPAESESAERLACVLYRSSEAGRPESIWINQQTLCGTGTGIGEEDRVALSMGFDQEAGSLEAFRVLAAGACVVEVRRQPALAPRKLAGLLRDQGVTVWWAAASLERVAPEFPWALKNVQQVVCEEGWSGLNWLAESLPEEVVGRVYGAYGTAETGGVGTLYGLSGMRSEGAGQRMEMEHVIPGKRLYLLDSELRGVPEGVVGEIYVGGGEQAWGYGAAKRTAESWVPDPWSATEGARLYRSGDLGRRRRDGSLEYLGRRDRRKLVGGVRVYEQEIEEALRRSAGVSDASVVISEVPDGPGRGKDNNKENGGGNGRQRKTTQITAWVVKSANGHGQNGTFAEELLRGLKQELPEVMIPQRLVEMEELPRTAQGDVNRGALLRLLERETAVREYVPPGTPVEEKLAEVWEQTLNRKPIGIHDNFFNIGGDSLLATQLVARTGDAFQVELPLRRLFEAPTIAQQVPIVEQLQEAGGWRRPPLTRVSREGAIQLSFAQQRLWVLDQVTPGSTSYNIPLALRLIGELDLAALKRGIREIVRRHEVLRTRFEAADGGPRQVIEAEVPLDLDVVELRGATKEEREAELKRLVQEEAQKPFDLKRGPLVRVKLLQVQEQDHALFLTMHHIVSDAVSAGVAVREMTALYAAYSAGQESPLPELPIQYADYAAWQRSWLKGEVLEEQIAYWKRELEDVKPLEVPVDRPRTKQTSLRGAMTPFALKDELSAGIIELSRREDVTIFMTLMAAFQTLLYRYSGQQEFAVGSPIAGRTEVGTERLIGFFVNTLVLPAQVKGSPSFREVLRRMKEKTVEAYGHQDVPFERLVDSLQIERNVNRSPLFQVMFAYQNAVLGADLQLGGVRLASLETRNPAAKFELLLAIGETESRLGGSLEYYTDLFDEATIGTMIRRLEYLLQGVVENPEQSIDGIALLSATEQRELERGWISEEEERRAGSLVQLVREHARRQPESCAVLKEDGEELSYRELDRQSNLMGSRLQAVGVRMGTVVGISLTGMGDWLTAALGVLKAGGAFVPLEPGEGEGRKQRVMEESGVVWVVTEERWEQRFEALGAQVMTLDGEGEDEGPAESESKSENDERLGCVLYRSSIAGRPESIWISQRTLCGAGAGIVAGDRVALSVGFDQEAGSLEAFRVLAAGACVMEVRRQLAPRKLAELLSDQGSTVVWAKSAELERLAREFPEALEHVRMMVCEEGWSGLGWLAELLPEEVVGRAYGAYGMAEAGGVEAFYGLSGMRGESAGQRMEMAHVMPGQRLYLLDSELRGVPEGVVGEIYLSGGAQAWGYGSPERTAESWVPDPWSVTGGGRLYRSGDLARRRKDGSLERVGRRDRRTILGGVRVYEQEIEQALRKHEGVKDAAVAIRELDKDSGKKVQTQITAWVVRSENQSGTFAEDLLRGLKEDLPEVMIPQKLVEMEELPRTAEGEVNRGALLRLLKLEGAVREYAPPTTPVEEKLTLVWEQTLEKQPIGIHDNFFTIGGDSLLATQLVSRTGLAFQVEMPLRRVFEAPTIAQQAPIVVQLQQAGGWRKPPITPASREGVIQLSFAQQRLWVLDQVQPGSTSYNIPLALRLRGDVDLEALKRGIREIVRRHEGLRTRFEAVNGEPRQIIEAEVPLALDVVELSTAGESDLEAELKRLVQEESQKAFDLKRGPLVRVKLLRLQERDYALFLTMHHIVSDAVSTGVAVREMTALYAAYSTGQESPLPELSIQYADYAVWQRSWLKGEVLEEQIEYWKRELEGVKPLEVPVDRPRTRQTSQKGDVAAFVFNEELSAGVKELSRREGVTLFMTIMAAFQTLLYRYSGQQDFAVGTPIAGRAEMETQGMIGFFVNTLVLPAQVSGNPSFREVLRRMKEKTVGAYGHQDVPFERLVDSLQIERNVNRTPLFQAMFSYQNAGLGAGLELSGITLESLGTQNPMAKFELLLNVADMETRLGGSLEYFTDLFDETTIKTMTRRLEHLLEGVVKDAGRSIDGIALLSAAEQRELERGWSTEEAVERRDTLVHLVREHARRQPEAVAVVRDDGEELSYLELERQSNRLGMRLQTNGVKAGSVVGISFTGMADWLTAALGVMKASGAFMPLEAEEAEGRRQRVMEEAGVAWVVTEERRKQEFEALGLQVMTLNGEGEDEGPVESESAERLACVLYRSGSAGKPESIWINQQTLRGAGEEIAAEDRVALSLGLDQEAGTLEAFRALAVGACVVEVRRHPALAPRKLAGLLRDQGVTMWRAAAASLDRVATEFPWALKNVRRVVCEDRMPVLAQLAESLPEDVLERVYGVYGMAETGGEGTLYRLSGMRDEGAERRMEMERVVLGKSLYLLDSELRGVPEEVVGEIYVAGGAQAWGYGAPERTAESWVPDPWSVTRGARLYRSGDLGRRRKDGSLEYVGRRDRRALVDGVRVYEQEIEEALRKCAGVKDAAVAISEIADGPVSGEKRRKTQTQTQTQTQITAWVVKSEQGESRNGAFTEDLLRELKQHLPETMIPQKLVEMEELPRTAQGEVNRGALLRLLQKETAERGYTPPSTPVEVKLTEVWEQTLSKKPIGVYDNFFNIGGDSLLATQLVARTGDAFQVEMPLRRLFEAPTIHLQAPIVVQLQEAGGWRKPPITLASREGAIQLSFAQQRLWFLDQVTPGSTSYNIPLALRLRGELNVEALKRGIREIVRRHEVLRTRFDAVDGGPRQAIEAEVPLNLDAVDLSGLAGEERETELRRLVQEETQQPFDLKRGPLVRVGLVRLADQDCALFLTMHHIVSDAVSMAVVVREMTALYAAYSAGQESPLPELPIQYADYAVWQRGWLNGEVLEEQIEYWRRELEGVKPLEVPVDRPRSQQTTFKGALTTFLLSEKLTAGLKQLSRREDATIFMTLMAAFQTLLYRYSGQQDFAVGSPVAGRTEVGTEGMIGFFVNTLVLPAQVKGSPSFREVLRRMKESTVGAYGHQDVPFERLVDSLQIERNVNRSPLFQVMFAYQNAVLGTGLELGEVKLESLDTRNPMAKFELLLAVADWDTKLGGSLEYYTDLFDEATISAMTRRLEYLLQGAVENPGQSIDGIALVSESERQQLVSGWKGLEISEERSATLSRLVSEHAQRQPEAWAVLRADGEGLSYLELDRRSNRLAKRLQAAGMKPGAVVGISLTEMSDWLTAAVGVLKADAAFVPLESTEAEGRRRWVMEEAGVAWVVTDDRWAQRFEALGAQVMILDAEGEDEGPVESEGGGRLACVLYRSSAEGRPQSIWINQQTLCGAATGIAAEDRVALSMGFDQEAGSLEAFRILAAGACVLEVPRQMAPRKLAEMLRDQGCTVVWAKATEIERLAREFPEALEGVRLMVCEEGWGGLGWLAESLPEEVVGRVYGVYGMAETGGVGTLYGLSRMRDDGAGQRMEMGHVTPGSRLYLLDSELRGIPDEIVGEIYVGGDEHAWGYGAAEKTAESWVPDPWSVTGGSRLFRTGDLGRRRKDGSLERVGRRDRRTLLGGARVYEQEIEKILKKRPQVQETAVVISETVAGPGSGKNNPNNKDNNDGNAAQGQKKAQARITAWVVKSESAQGQNGTFAEELLGGLKEDLPEVMIPQKLVELEKLPRTARGEINRVALLWQLKMEGALREYAPPSTPVEELLVQLWEQTLDKQPIGINDNFFNLGNSLLATQLVARTSAAFHVDLPLRRLFEYPTIAQLAQIVITLKDRPEEQAAPLPSSLLPLNVEKGGETLFCFHPIGGSATDYSTLVKLLPGVSIYGLQSEGFSLAESIRHTTIESMAGYYVELIRSVQKTGPYWLVGWSSGGVLAIEAAHILRRMGEEVAPVLLLDTAAPALIPWNPTDLDMIQFMAGGPDVGLDMEHMEKLEGDERLAYVVEHLKSHKFVPSDYSIDLGRRRLEVVKNNLEAANKYVPEPYSGRVVLLAAEGTPPENPGGWKKYIPGQLEVEQVAGQHSQLLSEPFVTGIAAHIQRYLEEERGKNLSGKGGS
ncbi:MAG: non-ribosomal peptide synthase/polyketide synthase [Acidobacteriia bacterium]|nr:non-ribosomal peptide synthase/polyketide synthase [Terriglobia bacterium]